MGLRALFGEMRARRAGRIALGQSQRLNAPREIVGPLGMMTSHGWEAMSKGAEAYNKSFDRRLPPSLFVSERDRTRSSHAMPLAERCIEDWQKPVSKERHEMTAELEKLLEDESKSS